MQVKNVYKFGEYYKKMQLCGHKEKIYKCDNIAIELDNDTAINVIGNFENGFYFDILKVYKNGKIYTARRYHYKYMTLVRDILFKYYNNKVGK